MTQALRQGLRQALFGWLNLALTAPGVYLWLGLPLVLRQHGWSGTAIGLFQLASLPTVLKFLFAMPLDRGGRRRAYRAWAAGLMLAYAAILCGLAWRELLDERWHLFALAAAAALAGTWADVPVNALAIRVLPASGRAWAGGIRSMALCLGAIAGGGLMLLAQSRWGWHAPFLIMAGALATGAALTLLVQDSGADTPDEPALAASPPVQLLAYFRREESRLWLPLLALLFPCIGTGWFYLKPLLLDQGLPGDRVAWLIGVAGGAVGALASAVGAPCLKRLGPGITVPAFAAFSFCALLALAAAVTLQASPSVLIACAMGIAAAMGANAALAFSLMMSHARPGLLALDYGIQSSVFALTRILAPLAAGIVLDAAGPAWMLTALAAAAAGVLLLARRIAPRLRL